jgi:streptogramin lyase
MAALLRASKSIQRARPRPSSGRPARLAPAARTRGAAAVDARRGALLLVGVLLAGVLAIVGPGASPDPAAAADPLGTITNHGLGVRDPVSITPGPDGNLWFASLANDAIGRVTPAGVVTMYSDPVVHGPRSIVAGADGNLWFTNSTGASIGRITPAGAITSYTAATIDTPREIAAGADGRLWFTSTGNSAIGAIDPTTFAISSFTNAALVSPLAITAGPDGNLWVTGATEETVIRLTTAGAFTAFTDPALGVLHELAAGPDGNVWFTNASNGVGKVTPAGVVTAGVGGADLLGLTRRPGHPGPPPVGADALPATVALADRPQSPAPSASTAAESSISNTPSSCVMTSSRRTAGPGSRSTNRPAPRATCSRAAISTARPVESQNVTSAMSITIV